MCGDLSWMGSRRARVLVFGTAIMASAYPWFVSGSMVGTLAGSVAAGCLLAMPEILAVREEATARTYASCVLILVAATVLKHLKMGPLWEPSVVQHIVGVVTALSLHLGVELAIDLWGGWWSEQAQTTTEQDQGREPEREQATSVRGEMAAEAGQSEFVVAEG